MKERGAWVLVAALCSACGGDSKPTGAAGTGGMETVVEVDSGAAMERDAGRLDARVVEPESGGAGSAAESGDDGAEAGHGGSESYANGGAGSPAPSGGQGGTATGGTHIEPMAGQSAPAEHVLWSQFWTVAIHPTGSGSGGYPNATMGLALDAGDFCQFGFSGASSGSSQEYPTDGACITTNVNVASGVALIFDSNGMNSRGSGGRAPLAGWTEAVTGHTVTKLRRSQTYTIQLLGSGDTSANYADFEGKWEAVGR